MWPDLIQKAKDGGLDVIQTYVFWNGHEPSPGNVKPQKQLAIMYIYVYCFCFMSAKGDLIIIIPIFFSV